ncbi:MAG: SDR family NAD(P)-dependent oxidoreductase [Bacillota bacterium]|nr:SDR family NAD(P)-dependent oxidoreductase [Bacillota bacterium]
MKNTNSPQKTIIITGGNAGLGYECAKNIAKAYKDSLIVLACRNVEKAKIAMDSVKKESVNNNITVLELDLASLESVRSFIRTFLNSNFPPLYSIVCNAGLQIVNGIKYTKDGFEATFGVNHLGHFVLVNMLLEKIVNSGRIIFVSSDTHDPLQKTGMPEPIYDKAEFLAYPGKSVVTLSGTQRYTTSKLCNIYCAYELDERIRSQTTRSIAVNAFNPGMMPGTGLARDYGLIARFAWKYILPVMTLLKRNVNTVSKSGRALASLVTNAEFENVTGKYFDGTRQISSSKLSYDIKNRKDLWGTSIKLVQLKQDETILPLD